MGFVLRASLGAFSGVFSSAFSGAFSGAFSSASLGASLGASLCASLGASLTAMTVGLTLFKHSATTAGIIFSPVWSICLLPGSLSCLDSPLDNISKIADKALRDALISLPFGSLSVMISSDIS